MSTLLLAERFYREYSRDRLALVVARSISFARAARDFTESELQMVVGSVAADT
jgi:S-methylmethionine-dependent homocysteine/selenocysteine methylase